MDLMKIVGLTTHNRFSTGIHRLLHGYIAVGFPRGSTLPRSKLSPA